MARIGKKGILSGLVGNLVFRNLDGQQVVQSRPATIKQTKATKESASEFRQCSRWAKHLRMALNPLLTDETDSYMYRRWTGAVYQSLLSNTHLPKGQRTPFNCAMKDLEGFDFNTHSLFKDYFLSDIEVTLNTQGVVTIKVPEFDPKIQVVFPEKVTNADLVVYVYSTNLEYNQPLTDARFRLPIALNTSLVPETLWNTSALPSGQWVIVVAKLFYYSVNPFTERKYHNSKKMSPAMVLFSGICAH